MDLAYLRIGDFIQFRLPMPKPLGHVFSYLVDYGGGYAMVDAGYPIPNAAVELLDLMDSLGVRPRYLVITHLHIDHYGLAEELRDALGLKIVMHEFEAELAKGWGSIDLGKEMASFLMANGVPGQEAHLITIPFIKLIKRQPPNPDVVVRGSQWELGSVKLLWTPGHMPGHLSVFHVESRTLFTGDFMLPRITPHVGLYPFSKGNPLVEYMDSLRAVAELGAKLALPAHEGPIENVKERVAQLLRHHVDRLCSIIKVLNSRGPMCAFDVCRSIPWTPAGLGYDQLSPLDRVMAVTETLAHLSYLEARGLVRVVDDGGLRLFRLVGPMECSGLVSSVLHGT